MLYSLKLCSLLTHLYGLLQAFSHFFILHCLTVMDDVRPSFQSRSVKATGCTAASITSNEFLSNTLHPNQDPLVNPGSVNIPLVNNRKGSVLPVGPRPDHLQLRLSISGPGDATARSLAERRLNRARSLPVKYRFHSSNAMLLSHSRHCRSPP